MGFRSTLTEFSFRRDAYISTFLEVEGKKNQKLSKRPMTSLENAAVGFLAGAVGPRNLNHKP